MTPLSIMVVAPHPDDETLGCGGYLLKMKQLGAKIHWVIGTQMTSPAYSESQMTQRTAIIKSVAKGFEFDTIHQLPFPAAQLDHFPMGDIVTALGKIASEIQPNILLIPNRSDIHSDHGVLFHACLSISKWFRYPSVRSILMYEVLSETDFSPALPEAGFLANVFYDITVVLEKKIEIMRLYHTEIFSHPFPRNEETIKAQALLRGAQAGCRYAEGFVLIKEIR